MSRPLVSAFLVALAVPTLAVPRSASAQLVAETQVQAGWKGTVGLGLVGAELGFMLPVAFGLDETWSLITFPIVGAAGGAVGGYYLDRAGSPAASVSMLTLGLVLAVPTVIVTVGASRYSTDDLQEDAEAAHRRRLAGPGLVQLREGRFHLQAPGFGLQRAYAGSAGGMQLQVSLFSGSF